MYGSPGTGIALEVTIADVMIYDMSHYLPRRGLNSPDALAEG